MRLQTKFTIIFLSVLLITLVILFGLTYKETRDNLEQNAYEICEKILAEVEATRQYVREVLRPKMYEIVKDDFIPEAMSTSFVARGQAERFLQRYPDYYIKFATENPRNPKNMADEKEKEIISFFRDNPKETKWRGIVSHKGIPYFTVATPYYFEESCIKCHGDPKEAPASLLQTYGNKNGFGRKVGDLTINTVGIPVIVSYSNIWKKTIFIFIPIMILAAITLLMAIILFRRLVTEPVHKLKKGVNSIAEGRYDYRVEINNKHEIGELAYSYNSMAESLKDNISRLKNSEIEREKLNAELKRRNFELEQILYVSSHDLTSPLVNVNGYSRELTSSLNELKSALMNAPADIKEKALRIIDGEVQESLSLIKHNIVKIDHLQKGVMKFLRAGKAEITHESLDMEELISLVLERMEKQITDAGAVMKISGLPSCHGNFALISEVFFHLISNAVKYLDKARPGVISIAGYKKGQDSVYCIEDNGIGIAQAYHENIFQIFHQLDTAVEGEGLGLSVTKKIVERHGGRIWVESEEGKGSRFYVSLPA